MRFIPIATNRHQELVNEVELMKGDVKRLMENVPLTTIQTTEVMGFAIVSTALGEMLGAEEAPDHLDVVQVAVDNFTEMYENVLKLFKEQLNKEMKQ